MSRADQMSAAVTAYRTANDAGTGFAPAADEIDDAVAALEADGWELLMARRTPAEVAVLRAESAQARADSAHARAALDALLRAQGVSAPAVQDKI